MKLSPPLFRPYEETLSPWSVMTTAHTHDAIPAAPLAPASASEGTEHLCAELLAGRAFLPPLTPVAPSRAACEEQIAALLRGHARALGQVS